jgi:tetratricopeptide (TPR) repeat protein
MCLSCFASWLPPFLAAAEPEPKELMQRIVETNDRLNYFVSLFSSWGTFAAIAITIFIAIITVALALVTISGVTFWRDVRRTHAQSAVLLEGNRNTLDALSKRSDDNDKQFSVQLEDVKKQLAIFQGELTEKLELKVRFLRQFITGELSYRSGDFSGALESFSAARGSEPTNLENLLYVARCHTYLDQRDEAIRILKALEAEYPSNPDPVRGLGLAFRFMDSIKSLEYLERALSLATSHPADLRAKIKNEQGLVFRDTRNFIRARECHTMARSIIGNAHVVTNYFLGIAEILNNHHDAGARLIEHTAFSASELLNSQKIRPIWAHIIIWSDAFISTREEERKRAWNAISGEVVSPYMRLTIRSHMDCLSEALERELVDDEKRV